MRRFMWFKLLVIAVLSLILVLPLSKVGSLVHERMSYKRSVIDDIRQSSAAEQTVSGLVLLLPYQELVTEQIEDDKGKLHTQTTWVDKQQIQFPEKLSITGNMTVNPKKRGIYEVRRFASHLNINAQFAADTRPKPSNTIKHLAPTLSVGVTDARGLSRTPDIRINGLPAEKVYAGNVAGFTEAGAHVQGANLQQALATGFTVQAELHLDGMGTLGFLPTGESTSVKLQSAWPHPSFVGHMLPSQNQVSAKGFTATWETTFLANDVLGRVNACENRTTNCLQDMAFSVNLIDPIDVYSLSDRAVKYGFLFILISFCTFYLSELMVGKAIHPIQYALVGISQVVFFLLLLSLSEQIKFSIAYVVAAGASITLQSYYVSHLYTRRIYGVRYALGSVVLYGALYFILRAEDHALLLGSLLVFMLVAIAMYFTRRIDWYKVELTTK